MDGTTVDGRYQIQELLGRGSTASVHKATDLRTGRVVALKFLSPAGSAIPQAPERFVQEATHLVKVRSPHVVEVLDSGTHEGRPYLVLEYLEAVDLHDHLDRHGPYSPAEARRVALGIARGLQAIHAAGIVHRDLKPGNVLLDARGEPRLADLGLAKDAADSSVRTRTGVRMGTPGFLAPEVLRGQRAGPAADLYALGVLLYFLHTDDLPFEGDDAGQIMQAQLRGPTPGALTGLPPAAARLVADLVAPDPAARPSLAAVIERLEAGPVPEAAAGRTVVTLAPAAPADPSDRRASRAPLGLGALGLCGVLALALATRGPGPPPPTPATAHAAVATLVDDLGRLSLRSSLEDLIHFTRKRDLLDLLHAPDRAEVGRRHLADFLETQPWLAPLRQLDANLTAAWWHALPAPSEDPRAHRQLRRRAAQRLTDLRHFPILADCLGGDAEVLPQPDRLLAPVLSVRVREDLPDRADTIPGAVVLMERCQIFTTIPEGATKIADMMLGIANPPSCPDGLWGAPLTSLELPLGPAAPQEGRELRLVLGYFSAMVANFLEVSILDAQGSTLLRLPVGFGRRYVFREGTPISGLTVHHNKAVEIRIDDALLDGEAATVRLRFKNFTSLMDGREMAGLMVAGVAVLPPGPGDAGPRSP